MRKIIYYTWIGIWIVIGTPIVFLIIVATWIQGKYHKMTCKKCNVKTK
jgi:hypothetical protein